VLIKLGSIFCHVWGSKKRFADLSHRAAVCVWPVEVKLYGRGTYTMKTIADWRKK